MHWISRSCAIGTALLLAAAGAATAAEEKVLNIYNWSDYIAEDTIKNFENETGIKVNYDVYDSNDVLEAKLLAGKTGYDIVVPSGSFLERQIAAGVFRKLEKAKLKNHKNLDPDIMSRVAGHDPGNAHAIPYMWGTTGVGYNVKMIKDRLPDAPLGSLDMVFKPEIVAKFADCGVTMLDASNEILEIALNYLGKNPHTENETDFKEVEDLLMKVRPHVKYFHSSQYINDLANGDICMAIGWSGDMFIARDRAEEAGQNVEVGYDIPKEGTLMWFDLMAIPADAPHPENAHLFLDYIMRPEVVAAVSNYVFYANGNEASLEHVDPAVKDDPAIYPPPEVKERLFTDKVPSPKVDRLRTRTWTRIKTGQ